MSEWKTIDSAPKDGTRIAGAVWSDKVNRWRVNDAYFCRALKTPTWVFDGWTSEMAPTHWMPLPEPLNDPIRS